MLMSTVVLLAALGTGAPPPEAGAPPTEARIKIDVDRAIGEVDPHLFGSFAEHLGRMIYGGIYEEGSRLSDRDGYLPIVEYGKQRGNTALDVWVAAPTYRVGERPALPYLDVSATYDPKQRLVYVNVLNRSRDRDISTRIENADGPLDGEVGVWELNHADLKATHRLGEDAKVRPVTGTEAAVEANTVRHTFPAHSLTVLRLHLK